ncbi:hypothetical protein [Amycolatopsis pigmentata]|uniref:Uncharacterized protein n=1 Tax=Amycolatopsis pigmentata TaxID=450801 RepID=A0ABW5FYL7_9PSEU
MSTCPSEPSEIRLQREPHVDAKYQAAMDLCRNAMEDVPVLHHLAHFTRGSFDFAYDRLASLPGTPVERDIYVRTGTQITNAAGELDRMLAATETGALIRTVVHGPRGLLVCDSVIPQEHVIGFCHDASALPTEDASPADLAGARQVDSAIGRLVTDLRALISQPPLNPGSWITPKPDDPEDAVVASPRKVSPPHVEDEGGGTVLTDLLTGPLSPADLQFVAYCKDFRVLCTADQLAHPDIAPYFHQISVTERREFYQELGPAMPAWVRKLGRMASTVIGPRLERVVLDVEQGAVYYYRIRPGEYLIGVTMDQGRVAVTDSKMAALTLACRKEFRPAIGR